MSKGIRCQDEFKQEAVNQVVIHGYSVAGVRDRANATTVIEIDGVSIIK